MGEGEVIDKTLDEGKGWIMKCFFCQGGGC